MTENPYRAPEADDRQRRPLWRTIVGVIFRVAAFECAFFALLFVVYGLQLLQYEMAHGLEPSGSGGLFDRGFQFGIGCPGLFLIARHFGGRYSWLATGAIFGLSLALFLLVQAFFLGLNLIAATNP